MITAVLQLGEECWRRQIACHATAWFFHTLPFDENAVGVAVAIFAYLVMDGETNWYEGVQLLAVYAIIAVALYYLPPDAAPAYHGR